MTVVRGALCLAARLRIKQDGLDYRLEIPARAGAVVVENRGNSRHIGGARIAGDHVADQRRSNVWTNVWMIKDGIERCSEIGRAGLICGLGHPVEQQLRSSVVL